MLNILLTIYDILVLSAFMDRLKTNERVQLQTIIDAMETEIIASFVESGYKLDYKGVWLKRIRFCSSEVQVNLVSILNRVSDDV